MAERTARASCCLRRDRPDTAAYQYAIWGFRARPNLPCSYTCSLQSIDRYVHYKYWSFSARRSALADGADYRYYALTRNVRWSTRVNFRSLVDGLTDFIIGTIMASRQIRLLASNERLPLENVEIYPILDILTESSPAYSFHT